MSVGLGGAGEFVHPHFRNTDVNGALKELRDKKEGEFIVRPSSEKGYFTISTRTASNEEGKQLQNTRFSLDDSKTHVSKKIADFVKQSGDIRLAKELHYFENSAVTAAKAEARLLEGQQVYKFKGPSHLVRFSENINTLVVSRYNPDTKEFKHYALETDKDHKVRFKDDTGPFLPLDEFLHNNKDRFGVNLPRQEYELTNPNLLQAKMNRKL